MQTRMLVSLTLAIATTLGVASASHAAAPADAGRLLTEIPDPELATLRGRFLIGHNTVAYFGVTMASSWTTANGQQLSGSVVLGMQFGPDGPIPVITFTPTMNIVSGAPVPAPGAGTVTRTLDGSGLANVNGLVQGIQVAGDGNRAINVTALRVTHGDPPGAGMGTPGTDAFASHMEVDDARVAAAFDPVRGVSLTLGVKDQGLVSQWIRGGSVGQLVQLTADGQAVDNQLRLDLVLGGADMASKQALRAASQALLQARMVSPGS